MSTFRSSVKVISTGRREGTLEPMLFGRISVLHRVVAELPNFTTRDLNHLHKGYCISALRVRTPNIRLDFTLEFVLYQALTALSLEFLSASPTN